jgi:hypothetical protein
MRDKAKDREEKDDVVGFMLFLRRVDEEGRPMPLDESKRQCAG